MLRRDRLSEQEVFERRNGDTAESRATAILEGLGLPAQIRRNPLSTLPGGFRLRVFLAQVLPSAPESLLLDKHTNHLDIFQLGFGELNRFEGFFSGKLRSPAQIRKMGLPLSESWRGR